MILAGAPTIMALFPKYDLLTTELTMTEILLPKVISDVIFSPVVKYNPFYHLYMLMCATLRIYQFGAHLQQL